MQEANTGLPTLYEELNRKTVDTLVWLTEQQDRGTLTPEQVNAGTQALWMAVSGLVSRDVMELLSHDALHRQVASEVLFAKDRVAVLTVGTDNNLLIRQIDTSHAPQSVRRVESQGDRYRALAALRQARSTFESRGYRREQEA